jgi:hypothetical protein
VPEPYNLLDSGFKNVRTPDGETTGFQLLFKGVYYRGVAVALIQDFEIAVGQETFKRDKITVTMGNRTFTLDEMAKQPLDVRWPWLTPAKLNVDKPGGLKPGIYDVEVTMRMRISYSRGVDPAPPQKYKKKLTIVM